MATPPEIVISTHEKEAEELTKLLPVCSHEQSSQVQCNICTSQMGPEGGKSSGNCEPNVSCTCSLVNSSCQSRSSGSVCGSLKGSHNSQQEFSKHNSTNDISIYETPHRIQHPLDEPILISIVKSGLYYIVGTILSIPVIVLLAVLFLTVLPFRIVHFLLSHKCGSPFSRCRRSYARAPGGADDTSPVASVQSHNSAYIFRPRVHCNALWPLPNPFVDQNVVHCIITVQGCLEVNEVRQLLWRKVVHATNPRNGLLLYPRLTQSFVKCWYGHRWEPDVNFELENHVRPFYDPDSIRNLQDLESCLNDLASSSLNPGKPLWETLVLSDFGDTKCTLLILRLHSLVADSLCLSKLLCTINDSELAFVYEPRMDCTLYQRLWGIGQVISLGIFQLPKFLMRKPPKAIWSHVRSEVKKSGKGSPLDVNEKCSSGRHILTWARVPSVDGLLKAEKLLHASVEELFLSFIAGAFHKHLKLQNVRFPPDIYVSVPISLDRYSSACAERTCRYTLLPVKLPVSTEGAIPRLWEVQRCLEDALDGPLPYGINTVAYVLEHILFPSSLAQNVSQRFLSNVHNASGCVATFLRGSLPASPPPRAPGLFGGFASSKVGDFSLASHRVHSTLFFNPVPQGVAASFTFVLLGKEILLSLSTDSSVFPNADALLVSFQDQIQKLLRQVSGRIVSPIAAQLIAAAKPIIAAASSVSEQSHTEEQEPIPFPIKKPQKVQEPAELDLSPDSLIAGAAHAEEKSLQELELLLNAVQRELEKIKGNPRGSREEYLSRLSTFENQMEVLQDSIKHRLRQNGAMPQVADVNEASANYSIKFSRSSFWDAASPRVKIHRPLDSPIADLKEGSEEHGYRCLTSPKHSIMDAFMKTADLRRHSACEFQDLASLRRGNSTLSHHSRMMRRRSRRMSSPMLASRIVDPTAVKSKALPNAMVYSP